MKILFRLMCLISLHTHAQDAVHIIPQPVQLHLRQEKFPLSAQTKIVAAKAYRREARYLAAALKTKYGFSPAITGKKPAGKYILLDRVTTMKEPEGYSLNSSSNEVVILGVDAAGVFRGIQTLLQVIHKETAGVYSIPGMVVLDYPRFSYRGMHLDVARHFFPVSFIKKYIDYLATYKYNTFHWHLTEDQGWRIEIKKYPALTMYGAWRKGTIIGRYPGTGNTNTEHGGFYTQEEIKDVVAYAAERHITIIPEIEMPGHSSAALASYPKLGCTGGPYKVQETWGVFEEVFCAGNDETFTFLQDVLDEVIQLFPSKLVHIGGDECPKESWKKCAKCQARIKNEGLKDEHELQSYFIRRIEKYLNARGRNIIGWDEILEGGLAPNAAVMSWRGEEGGIEAAKQKHNVVMTPGSHCYFDHTQSRMEDSVTIGGYTTVDKVYSYDPVPKELGAEFAPYILGAQGNVWTEYMNNPRKVEYMIFPRMLALSEVLWTPKDKKDWPNFENRMVQHFDWLNKAGINYSKAWYDLQVQVKPGTKPGTINVHLASRKKDGLIKHQFQTRVEEALQGPRTNTELLLLNEKGETTQTIVASGWYAFTWLTGTDSSRTTKFNFDFNLATGQKITLKELPTKKYPGEDGANGLVNGLVSERGIASPEWLGWEGADMEAVIDLGVSQKISRATVHTLEQNGSWIYLPQYIEVFFSNDGKNFTSAGKSSEFIADKQTTSTVTVHLNQVKARYIKLLVKNFGNIPTGKPGAGHKAWLFVDEIKLW
ncbi:MAG: family 20 glycosylhydrolase [Dinghuibacter sp.]|nr:family 20 glycosylhydrolase [Dinghuibacter sp.]